MRSETVVKVNGKEFHIYCQPHRFRVWRIKWNGKVKESTFVEDYSSLAEATTSIYLDHAGII